MIGITIFWVILALAVFHEKPQKKKYSEIENETLGRFLQNRDSALLTKKNISERLFDIQSNDGTAGRAVAIGKGYLLSAWHVIRDDKNYCAVLQSERMDGPCFDLFVLAQSPENDLVLLKSSSRDKRINLPVIALSSLSPSGQMQSEYTFYKNLSGSGERKNFSLDYSIEEFYMPKGSQKTHRAGLRYFPSLNLFEISGYRMSYDIKNIEKIYGKGKNRKVDSKETFLYDLSQENEYLFSFPVFNGDSGSGIFIKDHRGQLSLTGIVLRAWNTRKMIATPGNPLGHKAMQTTITFAANRDSIENFIIRYINRGY